MEIWRNDLENNLSGVEKFMDLLSESDKIAIIGHVNPDGDCIGSLTGLGGYLKENFGKEVTLIVPNDVPHFLAFLSEGHKIYTFNNNRIECEQVLSETQLVICMDLNSLRRLDELGEVVGKFQVPKVLIDHHLFPDTIFDLTYSYHESSSTCELAYWMIKELVRLSNDKKGISYNVALSLYTGMMTDTNNFANSVLPSTFRMASELVSMGIDKDNLQSMVFGGYSETRMRFMGEMLLNNMTIFPDLNASVMVITKADKQKFNFVKGDSEGFVNLPLNIKNVQVSALFTEDDDYIRVSLRSKGDFSVNNLSGKYFNGGGHQRAAGGKLFIPISEVKEYFEKSLREFNSLNV